MKKKGHDKQEPVQTQNEKQMQNGNDHETGMISRCIHKLAARLSACYRNYIKFYRRNFYLDSKHKILATLSSEVCEMLLQTYGLFLLGGIDLFNPNELRLSEDYQTIESFATIVGLNGILTGVAWIAYVGWHNVWYVNMKQLSLLSLCHFSFCCVLG